MLENINSPDDLKKIPKDKLKTLCKEIREKIISVMSRNGGHLASNLGVVELITAIHYVFNAPDDTIIFDVGHQSYVHKLLTGRNKNFESIRLRDGLSGFPRRKESIYDPVDSGHSSTAISSACGFACANKIQDKNNNIVAVIGDGALSGGEAFEGLNHIGHLKLPVIVIVNDNEMSIGKNVGAISKHIGELTASRPYQKLTDLYYDVMKKDKGLVRFIFWFAKKIEKVLKIFLGYENIFLNLGFEYIGPIDGHNVEELITILTKIKHNVKRPILLHVKTTKGKGFKLAEGNPTAFHGVTPYLMVNGKIEIKESKTFTDIFAEKIVEMGEKYKDVVAVTAAMEEGTGLNLFNLKFPDRFFDVGIAEQHATTFCAALGYGGLRPVFSVYSTFLMRAVDQIIQDICISKSPVIFAIDRAGIVGADGETHQGQFDISTLKMMPNMTILSPCDATELKMMFEYAYNLKSPVAIRYPKDVATQSQLNHYHPDIEKNPFVLLKEGKDLLIVVVGTFVDMVNDAATKLAESGVNCGILYLRVLKPIPTESLVAEIAKYKGVLVIEENIFSGSVAEEISSLIATSENKIKFNSINLPDKFIEHDTRKNILSKLGFEKENIVKLSLTLLNYSFVYSEF